MRINYPDRLASVHASTQFPCSFWVGQPFCWQVIPQLLSRSFCAMCCLRHQGRSPRLDEAQPEWVWPRQWPRIRRLVKDTDTHTHIQVKRKTLCSSSNMTLLISFESLSWHFSKSCLIYLFLNHFPLPLSLSRQVIVVWRQGPWCWQTEELSVLMSLTKCLTWIALPSTRWWNKAGSRLPKLASMHD